MALVGCGLTATTTPSTSPVAPLVVQAAQSTVQAGDSDVISVTQQGTPVSGGQWAVLGGTANGTVDASGLYQSPAVAPDPATVSVAFTHSGQTITVPITIVDRVPIVVRAQQSSVLPGGIDSFSATRGTTVVTGGQWIVEGGSLNGVIDATGLFHAPVLAPAANTVTVDYVLSGTTAKGSVSVLSPSPIIVQAAQVTIHAGGTDTFAATQQGVAVGGGTWQVVGGIANGTIDAAGLYSAPAVVPSSGTATVEYLFSGQTYTATIAIVSLAPALATVTPDRLTGLSTPVAVTGTGFVQGSMIMVNGSPVTTSFGDAAHLSATIVLKTPVSTTLQITISNPDLTVSQPLAVTAFFPQLSVQPSTLTSGSLHLAVSGAGFMPGDVVTMNGVPLTTNVTSGTTLTATGYLTPWTTGPVTIAVAAGADASPKAIQMVPLAANAVSYDAAARFATQAAFGPRAGLVEHIQQVGFDAFITEQFQQAPIVFGATNAKTTYIESAVQGNSLLRQRVAFALQSFIVPQWADFDPSSTYLEDKMESAATGNFRQLLTDITMDPNIGRFLNLPNNFVSDQFVTPPNQNFARELMQLFSIGPFLLNDDGSQKYDAQNHPIAAYDQDTVVAMTRALTGWYYPAVVNTAASAYNIDYSQPLAGWEGGHDHGAKTLFGTVTIPAGGSVVSDRDAALDAVFNHPNLPPFISRLLIQHLVTSNPSPNYIQRIATIFKDNGKGVRGDMAAVVRGILLDPEARLGDSSPSANDGFLQEPLLFQMFAMNILQNYGTDNEIDDCMGSVGEVLWSAPTVFGFVSPTYLIPGTTINSPEFALFTNLSLIQRSGILWGMISAQQPGYTNNNYAQNSWLFNTFTTVPSMIEALNHMAYHGTMSQEQQAAISNYVSQLDPSNSALQLQTVAFLALNADSYNVSH